MQVRTYEIHIRSQQDGDLTDSEAGQRQTDYCFLLIPIFQKNPYILVNSAGGLEMTVPLKNGGKNGRI